MNEGAWKAYREAVAAEWESLLWSDLPGFRQHELKTSPPKNASHCDKTRDDQRNPEAEMSERLSEERLEMIENHADAIGDAALIAVCREVRRLQARVAELKRDLFLNGNPCSYWKA